MFKIFKSKPNPEIAELKKTVEDLRLALRAVTETVVELEECREDPEINYSELAHEIDYYEVARELDYGDIAGELSVEEIADNLDITQIAEALRMIRARTKRR